MVRGKGDVLEARQVGQRSVQCEESVNLDAEGTGQGRQWTRSLPTSNLLGSMGAFSKLQVAGQQSSKLERWVSGLVVGIVHS